MAYCSTNFKTKKALKEAVERGEQVRVYSPGVFPCNSDGKVSLEGPHFPQPHTWYASAVVKDSYIVKGSVK